MALWGDYHLASGAGWRVYWRISQLKGGGLEVWFADFKGRRVLWRGTAPFAIVPYHRPHPGPEPPAPEHCYKDGLGPQCGGAPFTALKHGAPNTWAASVWNAAQDTDAVVVATEPATDFAAAHLSITAKFQCGWYQYVHNWVFDGDGSIHPQIAMGGQLNPNTPGTPHVHHFYFRLDLDIDGFPSDVAEIFDHDTLNDPGGDKTTLVTAQGKLLADVSKSRKWRVRDVKSKSQLGQHRGYDIELPQLAGRDKYSTGDVWVTVYRGDAVEQGGDIGMGDCTDKRLASVYAVGSLNTATGNDIVLWVAIRHHHEPRNLGEENHHLPYEYVGYEISPRNFDVFGARD